jgi:5-methylcytosine-specific restriction endonuclease McrA
MKDWHQCAFCGLITATRGHHVVPKSKGGTNIVQTCETCESFIHKTWTHNELRDVYNTVDSILATEKFQKFLKWRKKQDITTLFKSKRGKYRDRNPYH